MDISREEKQRVLRLHLCDEKRNKLQLPYHPSFPQYQCIAKPPTPPATDSIDVFPSTPNPPSSAESANLSERDTNDISVAPPTHDLPVNLDFCEILEAPVVLFLNQTEDSPDFSYAEHLCTPDGFNAACANINDMFGFIQEARDYIKNIATIIVEHNKHVLLNIFEFKSMLLNRGAHLPVTYDFGSSFVHVIETEAIMRQTLAEDIISKDCERVTRLIEHLRSAHEKICSIWRQAEKKEAGLRKNCNVLKQNYHDCAAFLNKNDIRFSEQTCAAYSGKNRDHKAVTSYCQKRNIYSSMVLSINSYIETKNKFLLPWLLKQVECEKLVLTREIRLLLKKLQPLNSLASQELCDAFSRLHTTATNRSPSEEAEEFGTRAQLILNTVLNSPKIIPCDLLEPIIIASLDIYKDLAPRFAIRLHNLKHESYELSACIKSKSTDLDAMNVRGYEYTDPMALVEHLEKTLEPKLEIMKLRSQLYRVHSQIRYLDRWAAAAIHHGIRDFRPSIGLHHNFVYTWKQNLLLRCDACKTYAIKKPRVECLSCNIMIHEDCILKFHPHCTGNPSLKHANPNQHNTVQLVLPASAV